MAVYLEAFPAKARMSTYKVECPGSASLTFVPLTALEEMARLGLLWLQWDHKGRDPKACLLAVSLVTTELLTELNS